MSAKILRSLSGCQLNSQLVSVDRAYEAGTYRGSRLLIRGLMTELKAVFAWRKNGREEVRAFLGEYEGTPTANVRVFYGATRSCSASGARRRRTPRSRGARGG